MRMSTYWAVILVVSLTALVQAEPISVEGQLLGDEFYGWQPEVVLSSGDYVYVVCTSNLLVYEANSRSLPHLVSSVRIDPCNRGAIFGDILVLNNEVVDISNPENPVCLTDGESLIAGRTTGMVGDVLYRSVDWWGEDRVDVVDFSDPAHPSILQTYPMSSPRFQITDDGYMIQEWGVDVGLKFFDLSDPSQMQYLGPKILDIGEFDLLFSAISDGYLYLISDGLVVVDVHDVTDSFITGVCEVEHWDERLLARAPTIAGDRLYIGNYQSMDIFDISDPSNPVHLRHERMNENSGRGGLNVAEATGLICVTNSERVLFMDYSDPFHPATIMDDELFNQAFLMGVVNGNAVFDIGSERVMVADTKQPGVPTWVHDNSGGDGLYSHLIGPYLAVGSNKRQLYDITTAANPVLLNSDIELPFWNVTETDIGPIELSESSWARGWNISEYGNPYPTWELDVSPVSSYGATANRDIFYVYGRGGLASYQLVDDVPTQKIDLHISSSTRSIVVTSLDATSDAIYVTRDEDGLEIWISDEGVFRDSPWLILDDVDARFMQKVGHRLYVQHGDHGVRVYNISDPALPVMLADYDLLNTGVISGWFNPHFVVSGNDLVIGATADSPAQIFKNLFAGIVANEPVVTDDEDTPSTLVLGAARPNPFNPSTTLSFDLPTPGHICLTIHDARGRRVKTLFDGSHESGRHTFEWNGRGDDGQALASGVFMAMLETENGRRSVKMVLAR